MKPATPPVISGELIFMKFVPVSSDQKVPLFTGWGDLTTEGLHQRTLTHY